jgi:hypothetical protein
MALKIISDSHKGIPVSNIYVRIDKVEGNKESLQFVTGYYAMEGNVIFPTPYKTNEFGIKPSVLEGSQNFIKQGYEYLKTIPEFSEATDILE